VGRRLRRQYPAQERGVTTEVRPDDGSKEWADLYARASVAPVRDGGKHNEQQQRQ
jgi:hypothetical protein